MIPSEWMYIVEVCRNGLRLGILVQSYRRRPIGFREGEVMPKCHMGVKNKDVQGGLQSFDGSLLSEGGSGGCPCMAGSAGLGSL